MTQSKGFLLLLLVLSYLTTACSQSEQSTSTDTATRTNVPSRKLIPFGFEYGDITVARGDDQVSPPIRIPIRFPFFNHKYDEIKIEINGLVLFGNQSYTNINYTPQRFPVDAIICVAPFWADIITNRETQSNIFYREITDQTTLTELDGIIGNAFPGQITHRFIWAFVVTWYEVPGYGLTLAARNTFQAIIATNGISSFAVYNFDKVQWTSGTASNNIHAQAGFNAGDLINYFLIPKSFTPQVVDIVSDSNVGYPGRFIFSIGGDITDVECNNTDGLQIAPFRGPPDGGYEIKLYGICFNEIDYIVKVDQQVLTNCRMTTIYMTCDMPMTYNGPSIPIEIFTRANQLVGSTNFLVDIPEDNSELLIEDSMASDSFIEMAHNDSITLRFKKNAVTKNYVFNIRASYYEAVFSEDNQLISITPRQRVLYLAANLSSLETLTIRYNDIFSSSNTRVNINDLTITTLKLYIRIASPLIPPPLKIIYGVVSWTATAIKFIQNQCAKWEAKLPQLPAPSSYQSQVPQCPCRVPAVGQNRFPVTFNNFQTDSLCNTHKPNTCKDHTGAVHCYRRSFAPNGPGVQCCYNNDGMIITNPRSGAGGLEVQANSGGSIVQRIKHALFDQLPSWACCKLPQIVTQIRPESCDRYHQQRPSFQCENVPLPFPGGGNGDPHFTTLDGVDYTFNGYGEYSLVRSHSLPSASSIEAQIRTKPIVSSSSDDQATAIVAFVVRNGNYSKIQFELFDQLKLLEIRINDQPLDNDVFLAPSAADDDDDEVYQLLMTMSRTIQFDNNQMSITQTGRTTFKIAYSNNVQFIVTIREQYDFMNIVTILPRSYERHCQGLLGNLDGDKTNEFLFQDGQTSLTSSEQQSDEEVFRFGESWRVSLERTLFKYLVGESYNTHQNLRYRPIFQKELLERYKNNSRLTMADENCRQITSDKGKQQCIYDILITNDKTMSELHNDFQANLNEWHAYADLVNDDNHKSSASSFIVNRWVFLSIFAITISQIF